MYTSNNDPYEHFAWLKTWKLQKTSNYDDCPYVILIIW